MTVSAMRPRAVSKAASSSSPGPRPHYGAPYYGCFVRDLDGHKIEAAFWDDALAEGAGGA